MRGEDLDNLLKVFRAEAQEILDTLGQVIDTLRTASTGDIESLAATAMRLAHNLKGASSSVGFNNIAEAAHRIEDVLAAIRRDRVVHEEKADIILAEIDSMQHMIAGEENQRDEKANSADPTAPPRAEAQIDKAATVRVETQRLDRLMAFAGELLVTQARLSMRNDRLSRYAEDLINHVQSLPQDERNFFDGPLRNLDNLVQSDRHDLMSFSNLVGDLSAAMKQVRMMRLNSAAPVWRRAVRDSAERLGKRAQLVMDVGDAEIDKNVLDRLHDPILHLLRNAVDHGIENQEQRQAKGKPATGTIRIHAEPRGGAIRLVVDDDGGGIDLKRVARAAVRHGRMAEERATQASEAELSALLFEAGFTTSEKVTAVSGRGVGLDVVRREVEAVGGNVELIGRGPLGGTSFVLTVPTSLLSTHGLLVRVGSHAYAFPIDDLEKTLKCDRAALRDKDNGHVLMLGDAEPLRTYDLARVLGVQSSRAGEKIQLLVLERGGIKIGLIVDEILAPAEFVTHRLPWNLEAIPAVSGAVILADGSLAVAIDVPQLFSSTIPKGHKAPSSEGPETRKRAPRVLVVDDSLSARTLHRNTLVGAGFDVELAVDGSEAWRLLEKESFDVIVSDVLMPELDGVELTRRIRSDARLKQLKIVLVSSQATKEDIEKGLSAGANEYVVKGDFAQEKLLRAVSTLAADK